MSETPQNTPEQNQSPPSENQQPRRISSGRRFQRRRKALSSPRPALRIWKLKIGRCVAILGAHVDGINIDEELEFVGPTGKYRPQSAPAQPQEAPQQQTIGAAGASR